MPARHCIAQRSVLTSIGLSIAALVAGCNGNHGERFASSEEAVSSLVSALRQSDKARIETILGPDADEVLHSGDPVEDKSNLANFLAMYDRKHALVAEEDGTQTLIVGDTDWPMPIPLARVGGDRWAFDLEAGKDELLSRRIGRNEIAAINTCLAIADAQDEYAELDADGNGKHDFAAKLFSDEGKRNGLYWKTSDSQPQSPLGPLVANASAEGYSRDNNPNRAYHGYRYRILTAQGASAPGGKKDYLVNGALSNGFAILASPVSYGNSGIMTFMVGEDGVVYERDLGDSTPSLASRMSLFDPDAKWSIAK